MKKFRRLKVPLRFDPATSDYQKYVFEIAIFVAIVILITLNLPFTQVPVLVNGTYVAGPTDFPIDLENLTQPVKTGWPLTFYRSHHFGTAATVSDWHFSSLLFDLIAAATITGAVGLIFWPRRKRFRRKSRVQSKLVYMGIAFAAAVCVAAYFGVLAAAERRDENIANQLRKHGDVVRVAFVPEVIASVLPESWAESRLRIALVDLKNVDDRLVELAVEQPELRSLRLSGSGYSTSQIKRIDRLGFLQDVALKSIELTVADLAGLAECPLVSTVNLTGSRLGKDELNTIASIPRISRLSLFESNLLLSDVTDSKLKKKLTHLIVSRPELTSDTLNLSEWYQLREIRLLSRSNEPNPNKLQLEIADLPLFNAIYVDPLQRVALSAKNVPLLSRINAQRNVDFGLQEGQAPLEDTASMSAEPVGVWFETLRIIEAGNLKSLNIDGRNLSILSIEDCKSLGSITIQGNAVNRTVVAKTSDVPPAPIDKSVRQQIILALSDQVKDVPQIRLPGMKLDDLFLKPLTFNKGITSLDLSDAQLDLQSMTTLKEMRQLKELNLTGIPLDPQTFVWINNTFPKLENLRVSHQFATRVLFQNHSMLKGITLDQYEPPLIDALKLVNLKSWKTPITVAENARIVNVQDLPSLTGLAVPNPCKFTVREVDGLEWFASGGSNCNNESVSEVLNASSLRRLVMVAPTASMEVLAGIYELEDLVELNIAAANVDDAFFVNWKVPPSLTSLIIDDCAIEQPGFSSLMLHQNWQAMSLARTNVPAEALGSLGSQSQLQAVGLAGLTIDIDTLEALGRMPNLKYLDLHGASLPGGAAGLLQTFVNLEQINLADCGLTRTEIDSIKVNLPELVVTAERDSWDFSHLVSNSPTTERSVSEFVMPELRPAMFSAGDQSLTSSR